MYLNKLNVMYAFFKKPLYVLTYHPIRIMKFVANLWALNIFKWNWKKFCAQLKTQLLANFQIFEKKNVYVDIYFMSS